MHRGDEGQPEPPLVSSRSVGCSAILRGQANWPRVPGLTPQVQPTVRFLREFLGSSFPICTLQKPKEFGHSRPLFFRGRWATPGHNAPQRAGSADREIRWCLVLASVFVILASEGVISISS